MPRYAAIDIGSNSVRMLAAEAEPSTGIRSLASDREVTRLGQSVFRTGRVSQEAMDLVCTVLSRMAQTYQKLNVLGIRVVATAAVRDASNQAEFIKRASDAAGSPVETISGQEEARLIHLGVQTRWPHPGKRVLMIDIGGGSAEIILSQDQRIEYAISKQLGALRLSEIFLRSDPPRPADLRRLEGYIEERIAPAIRKIGATPIDRVIATSASASAAVSAINSVPRVKRDEADRKRASVSQLRKLYKDLSIRTLEERRRMVGIGPRRAEIIVPGIAVLLRVLEDLDLPALYHSSAGVRDGIIADLAARGAGYNLSQLPAEQRATVEQMAEHYHVPIKHARKVARLANALFTAMHSLHKLSPLYGRLLEAAAYLHDIGHYVSDNKHHKHSYYLVANSDLPGFTARERELIANLCRYHRKAVPNETHLNWQGLDLEGRQAVHFLAPILRLADSLDRSQEQRPTRSCSNCIAAATSTSKPGPRTASAKSSARSSAVRWWSPGRAPKVRKHLPSHFLLTRTHQ
jgi:exopolyphosphatase/guanosine-5'-triphosphate,3'-diphosphate pyrophosphatase